MKKITSNFLILAILAICFSSCTDVLDTEPEQSLSTENALTNLDDAQAALVGAYDVLSGTPYYGRNFVVAGDIAAGNAKVSPTNSGRFLTDYNYSKAANNNTLGGFWSAAYRCIAYSNNIINNIDALEGAEAQKNSVLGQALFLRAMSHFDLVRLYAQDYTYTSGSTHLGVPYIKKTEFGQPARETVKSNYENIIADLKQAEGLLGETGAPYSASSLTVKALLARVYLSMSDWQNAYDNAKAVIDSGKFSLVSKSEYVDSWSKTTSAESIFSISMLSTDYRSTDALGYIYIQEGYGDLLVTTDLSDLYASSDVRGGLLKTVSGNLHTYKYPGVGGTPGLDNTPVIRLSEMYLIAAEAATELGDTANDGLKMLNAIRQRAGLSAATTTNAVDLVAEILLERRRELAFEGHLLFDLKRRHLNLERKDCNLQADCNINYPSDKFPYPIPQFEMDANKSMEQNAGY